MSLPCFSSLAARSTLMKEPIAQSSSQSISSLTELSKFRSWNFACACSLSPSRPILHNLPSRPCALSGRAFHKALELDRAMFARKMNGSLAHALVATKVGILSNTPAGVTAQKKRVAGGIAQRRLAGIVGADAREDRLQLLEAVLGILLKVWGVIRRGIGRRWRICSSSLSARIIDQQPT